MISLQQNTIILVPAIYSAVSIHTYNDAAQGEVASLILI